MPRDVLLVLRIVHAAMGASILVYLGVMAVVTRRPPVEPVFATAPAVRAVPPQSLTVAMAALATASLVAILVMSRRIAGRGFTMAIVCWALADSIAVYGLVLGMVHRDMAHFLPFAAVSLLAMLFLAPRKSWASPPDTRLDPEV